MILKKQKIVLLILIAFIFSFSVRLIWVYHFNDAGQFKFNNEFMINTNDGYYFAEGARDILLGITEDTNDRSPIMDAVSIVTAFIAKIIPISLETIIFYLPAFFSSLIVIPIILIAKELDNIDVGFIAALVGSITWSYYNRTMVGYYDSDMLNIVFPTFILWTLVYSLKNMSLKYVLFTAFLILFYRWWYPQSYSLVVAFGGMIFIWTLYQWYKKESIIFQLKLLTIIVFSLINLNILIKLSLVIGLYIVFSRSKFDKYILYIFAISVLVFFITGGIDPIIDRLSGYIFKDSFVTNNDTLSLHFYSVINTIREAGQIPFETFANRISGHQITFLLAIVGYILFIYKNKIMLLSLPMVGLGFIAMTGGLRFTVYAVPIMALGIGYLIYQISKLISKQLKNNVSSKSAYYAIMLVLTLLVLYPNIKHINQYKVPTVFNQQEVKVLAKLRNIADREDYVIAWWDYGYPIRYYSDVKTLVDGGKHSGDSNYPVSFVLNKPQSIASKMARLDVEYTESSFRIYKEDENLSKEDKRIRHTNIKQMTLDYGFNDVNDFLISLSTDISLPKKTRDIYIYLPHRMLNIFPTVTLFSNIDLMTGKQGRRPLFYQTNRFKEENNIIDLGNNIRIFKQTGEVQIGKQKAKLNNFALTAYGKNGKLNKRIQTIDKNSNISAIYMKNYNKFLIVDRTVYNSLFIQLFVLENYNKKLFEPIVLDPLSKIYKLKI